MGFGRIGAIPLLFLFLCGIHSSFDEFSTFSGFLTFFDVSGVVSGVSGVARVFSSSAERLVPQLRNHTPEDRV